jgi:hypothetical protein
MGALREVVGSEQAISGMRQRASRKENFRKFNTSPRKTPV